MICGCYVRYHSCLGKTDPQYNFYLYSIIIYLKFDKRSENLTSVHTISLTDILENIFFFFNFADM